MGVACSLLKGPEPKMIEAVAPKAVTPEAVTHAPEAVTPKAKAVGPEAKAVGPEAKAEAVAVAPKAKAVAPEPKNLETNEHSLRNMLISTAVRPISISYIEL